MKKALIGLAVLGIFAVYSLGIRHQQPLLPKPTSLSSAGSSSSSASSSSGSAPPANSSPAASSSSTSSSSNTYSDGTFTGTAEDAYYGNVQVAVVISNGKIQNVKILQYPNSHSASVYINQQALPYLQQETVQSQNANIQIISGATFTSQAFIQSLQTALNKA